MFTDKQFPANKQIIGEIESEIPSSLLFLRPNEFLEKEQLFEENIKPTEIKQGQLGDCYFISSLAAIAEQPKRIQKMIKSLGNGKYQVNLYYNGKYQEVIIDDLVPCVDEKPFFSYNEGNACWVSLIEKAYAKVNGNYANMEGGMPIITLSDLTGMPVKKHMISEFNEKELFNKVQSYCKKNYCVSSFVPEVENENKENEYGLLDEHSYTILGAYEIDNHLLFKIRDFWGECKWKGKWNWNDSEWTEERKKKLNVDTNDSYFFIEIDDFMKHFEDLVVVYYKDNWNHFSSKQFQMKDKQMTIEFEAEDESVFTITQDRDNDRIGLKMWCIDENNLSIGGISHKAFTNSFVMRGQTLKLKERGKYRIVIETHTSFMSKLPVDLVLSVRSNQPVNFGEVKQIDATKRIAFVDKKDAENAEKCPVCGIVVPAKGVAKTSIGTFHIQCFVCSECGKQLTGEFMRKGEKIVCTECGGKK